MEDLLNLLRDGKSRSIEMLAMELNTSVETVNRNIEFLERAGLIRRIDMSGAGGNACGGCNACGSGEKICASCAPEGGFQNMGVMWEVL